MDSIQTLYSDQLQSAPGSVGQVRECAAQLTRYAKSSGAVIVLVAGAFFVFSLLSHLMLRKWHESAIKREN